MNQTTRGRCIGKSKDTVAVRNQTGAHELSYSSGNFEVGDIVEVQGSGEVRVLTPNRKPERTAGWMESVLNARRIRGIRVRTQVEAAIRSFFLSEGFLETRTPLITPSPGMEPHIRPFEVKPLHQDGENRGFLPTSPEFAMKKLLVGGLEKIFQLSPAFREEPRSTTHNPEFTMLEWYRSYAGYEQIMQDVENLFAHIAREVFGSENIPYNGEQINVSTPWPRLRVRDLFQEEVGVDLTVLNTVELLSKKAAELGLGVSPEDTWDDVYFRIWLNLIEPRLPNDRAVFVTRYPASQAALSVIDEDPDGTRWAKRFEVYAGGLELGNAFEELTDPEEQRKRFVEDMELRTRIYGEKFPKSPIDEDFLDALTEGMPPAGGIAMGVDRIVMLFADEVDIQYTKWLP